MLASVGNFVVRQIHPHSEVTKQAQRAINGIPYELSENYRLFTSKYSLQTIILSGEKWMYYDTDSTEKNKIPLILIPGTTGTANVFFQQLLSLGLRGYRLISVTIPCTSTVESFIKSFNKFLSYLDIDTFHLLGTSLGGYLSLLYTNQYPLRVLSLILTNSFINTRLFQSNAPWISSDVMPEFYLRRYITQALPRNKQQSIQMALATDFVLKQVNALNKDQLSSRLSLNLCKNFIDKLNPSFSQRYITIIDTYNNETIALDQSMTEQLYNLLKDAKYSLMKFGGDFPYLSNYMEYSMLIQVHLKRYHKLRLEEEQRSIAMAVAIREQQTNHDQNMNKMKKHNLPNLLGVFDHRRQYHDSQKEALFVDSDHEYKDGVIHDYNSDSSHSSDMNDIQHTEHDKRKSLLFNKSKSYDNEDNEPHIIGIEDQRHPTDKDENNRNRDSNQQTLSMPIHEMYSSEHYTNEYVVTDDKKKQYLMDRKIKKKRYREYLARKKKAYKKYLKRKGKEMEHGHDLDEKDQNEKKSKSAHKHRHKHKRKGNDKHKKKKHHHHHHHHHHHGKKKKVSSKHQRKEKEKERKEMELKRREREKQEKQMKHDMRAHILSSVQPRDQQNNGIGKLVKNSKANRSLLQHGSGMNLADMGFGVDDLYRRGRTVSIASQIDSNQHQHENDKDIVEVGSNLISPRHSITEQMEHDQDSEPQPQNGQKESKNMGHRPHQQSLLETLKIDPISEEMDNEHEMEEMEEKKEDEEKTQFIHKPRTSKHRALRIRHHGMDPNDHDENDMDQTPMQLAQNSKQKPRPTTVGGHRYIPSYDSQINDDFVLQSEANDRHRSNSYVPWNDERQRQDSFISELGDFDFVTSEIEEWPREGTDGMHHQHDSVGNLAGYTPVAHDAYSSNPANLHHKFPSNASLYIISKANEESNNSLLQDHRVELDDENVGDSIW